jgi:hypothetical protein
MHVSRFKPENFRRLSCIFDSAYFGSAEFFSTATAYGKFNGGGGFGVYCVVTSNF